VDKSRLKGFESREGRLCSGLILVLPHFELLFVAECDASGVRIGAVLT